MLNGKTETNLVALLLLAAFATNLRLALGDDSNTEEKKLSCAVDTGMKGYGKMSCDNQTVRPKPDEKMMSTHVRCPTNPIPKRIDWSAVNGTNCKQLMELGRIFAPQYECIYRLYDAINPDGTLDPVKGLRYAKVFEPKRTSRFMKFRISQCIERYSAVKSKMLTLDEWKARWKGCNWVKFSACHISAEVVACNRRRSFQNQCENIWDKD